MAVSDALADTLLTRARPEDDRGPVVPGVAGQFLLGVLPLLGLGGLTRACHQSLHAD